MPSKQKTKFAILGLLSWRPMSGYDIKRFVDVGLSHFWNESYGQIYPTLESLVDEQLASKKEGAGKRRRHVYSITRRGRAKFRAWLAQPTTPPVVRNEFELKFFLSLEVPVKERLRLIDEYREQQRRLLAEYELSEEVLRRAIADGCVPAELEELIGDGSRQRQPKRRSEQCELFLLTLRHGIHVAQARLRWCDEVSRAWDG